MPTTRKTHYFTMPPESWRRFYDRKTATVLTNWGDQLALHFPRFGVTCTVAFRYHHVRSIESRKTKCNLFNARGHCTNGTCPVLVEIEVEQEPKNEQSPAVFKLIVIGDAQHDAKKASASRQLTGVVREAMGMFNIFRRIVYGN
jgi:hypothetical protein